jgi:cold shock CspA family protein
VPAEGGQDIFVHMDVLRECGIRALRQGQRVRVQVAHTPKGMAATEVELEADDT